MVVCVSNLCMVSTKSGDIFYAGDDSDHKPERAVHVIWLRNSFQFHNLDIRRVAASLLAHGDGLSFPIRYNVADAAVARDDKLVEGATDLADLHRSCESAPCPLCMTYSTG